MDLTALRRTEFAALDDGGVFLNSASIGPLPSRSVAVLAAANRDRARPALWPIERINAILGESRWLASRLLNAHEEEIALMPNTTTGLNVAAHAMNLGDGDIVVTFDGEFPSNIYPYLQMASKGVVLERLPRLENGWPDEARLLERIADPRVKAVVVSLTQFANGYTVDLDALSRATRTHGTYLVVDAIQGIGHVPVDVRATPVDFLACGAQKWLLSPWGTGFLYVRPELVASVGPTFAGWAAFQGTNDYTRLTAYDPRPWPDARRFELITLPIQDFAAMNASVALLLQVGVDKVAEHASALHGPLIEWANGVGATITSPPRGVHGCAILCVRPRGDVQKSYQSLFEGGVQCSLREGAIRFSMHCYNTADDIERAVTLLARAT